MKNITRNIIKSLFVILVVSASSCSDYLDIDSYFDDEFKIDSVFSSKRYIEAYMWGAADMFPDEAATIRYNYTPGPLATDEGFNNFRVENNVYYGLDFACGFINPDRLKDFNQWGKYYKIIRKCNLILTRMDEVPDMSYTDRFYIEGYTRFIRAYAYYNIIVDYGCPILLGDEVINTNEDIVYYDRERSTYDEAVEYVCGEFEKAAQLMPLTVSNMDLGRPTQGAAYGLVARLRLIHTSPLFNGGQAAHRYFSQWTRKSDGRHYVSQAPDERRWAVAAAAAKRVMDLEYAGNPLYSLYTVPSDDNTPALPTGITSDPGYYQNYPDGAGGIDPFRSYSEIFTGEAVSSIVPEYVWAKKSAHLRDLTRYYFPNSLSGYNRICVTQKVVDAYLMADGRTTDNSSVGYPYNESGFTSAIKTFSGYRLNSGVSNMYANREMRFYASVGFSECYWSCSSSTEMGTFGQTICYYFDDPGNGRTASSDPMNYPATGYVIKKFVHPMDAWLGQGNRRVDKTYPIIRYAEILLSYAEALNNLTSSYEINGINYSRNAEEIRKAFNQVRYRAGLPGITGNESQSEIQKQIERERMVEFLFENRRYYDVRRWGIYEETEREPVMGMNVDGTKSSYYQKVIPSTSQIRGRIVDKKLLFLPVPRAEVRRLPSFDQNPGWE
ncbi:RagB/SusD family nutrient uptake outer membrane protein [Viscerimonas tarda]